MQYSDFRSAIDYAESILKTSIRHVSVDGESLFMHVKESGWPARIGLLSTNSLNDAGWEFDSDIDAWYLNF